jgi:hypothetical protein
MSSKKIPRHLLKKAPVYELPLVASDIEVFGLSTMWREDKRLVFTLAFSLIGGLAVMTLMIYMFKIASVDAPFPLNRIYKIIYPLTLLGVMGWISWAYHSGRKKSVFLFSDRLEIHSGEIKMLVLPRKEVTEVRSLTYAEARHALFTYYVNCHSLSIANAVRFNKSGGSAVVVSLLERDRFLAVLELAWKLKPGGRELDERAREEARQHMESIVPTEIVKARLKADGRIYLNDKEVTGKELEKELFWLAHAGGALDWDGLFSGGELTSERKLLIRTIYKNGLPLLMEEETGQYLIRFFGYSTFISWIGEPKTENEKAP